VDDIHVPPKSPPNSETDDTLLEAGKRLGLPPKELQILLVGAETPEHKDICARLGMRENTLRTHYTGCSLVPESTGYERQT
jgi:hypothetical protein